MNWRTRAACRGDDETGRPKARWFFAAAGELFAMRQVREKRAKELCAKCPVRRPCREWGANESHGVNGMTTPHDRGFRGEGRTRRGDRKYA